MTSLPDAPKTPTKANISKIPLNKNGNNFGQMFISLPVCSPSLIKDRGVTEGIAEDEGMDSGRFVSVFSKFLGQKASQGSPKKMNLIVNKHKEDLITMINPEHKYKK